MLLGRAAELRLIDELLDGVRTGDGRAVLMRGDAGIGKTTLLDALVERCGEGVTVLRARGVETEAELAFAALSDLLGPIADRLGSLPAPQSAALAAALALGPPAPGDRLAVCVATLALLRAAGPVVAVVDDAQWLDAASLECVLYAARRAGGPVAFALASREPAAAEVPERRLDPLGPEDSLELLRRAGPELAPSVASALVRASAGNPLALVELPATLTAEQRAGVVELVLPLAPGSRLHGAFAGRVEELDTLARRALLVAAAHAGRDLTVIAAACSDAGTDAARLVEAEQRGLVRIGSGEVTFTHPIIRGAAYHGASPAERRRAHRALGGVQRGERRAWHLAAAAVGPDEEVAAELERVAGAAAARRGFASASAALERASRLSQETEPSARRMLAAAEAAGAAGAPQRALTLLQELSGVADAGVRARAEHLRGRIMVWSGAPGEATSLLVREAERVAAHDPELAAAMLADAANGCTATNAYHRAEELAERAAALVGGAADARAPVVAMLGWALILRGKAPRARIVLREAERLAEGFDPVGPHWPWLHLLLRAQVPLGDFERARADGLALADRAREAGALATLGSGLIVAADAAFRLGEWGPAADATAEAMRVAGETGQQSWHGYALTTHTRLAAARGLEAEGREAAGTALRIAEAGGISTGLRFVHGALGFLELSFERVEESIAQLERVERLVEGSGHEEPTLVPWTPDLVEAYVRAGRLDDARRVLATLERQAASTETAFPAAAAARCRGMLTADVDRAFGEALRHHDRRPMPFERARTLLAYGRRLHRMRRRADAREHLREALDEFERLGAAAWAAQAQNELRAAGARRGAVRDGRLTAQELRVVAAVRRGATNREIAGDLFLAPKTVEYHLGQIYRKVGVHSRTQLLAALERQE